MKQKIEYRLPEPREWKIDSYYLMKIEILLETMKSFIGDDEKFLLEMMKMFY